MKHLLQDSTAAFHFIPSTAWRALLLLALFATATTASIQAQTFTVLHTFTGERGGHDRAHPMSGLVMDQAGNLYGTTFEGGLNGEAGQAC